MEMMKNKTIFVYDARGNGTGGVAPTITGDHQNRITDYTAIALEIYEYDEGTGHRPLQSVVDRRCGDDS